MPPTADVLIKLAVDTAKQFNLDPPLVCGLVEQESAWNPWAMRYEPAFFARYVAPQYTNNKISATEAYERAFSFGLLQLMGQVAREIGFPKQFLSELCDPATGLFWGCKELQLKLDKAKGDVTQGLLLFNGGNDKTYPTQVLARVSKYA